MSLDPERAGSRDWLQEAALQAAAQVAESHETENPEDLRRARRPALP